jgi:hypothetical protein
MTDRELLEKAAKAAGLTYRDDLWSAGHVQNQHGSWYEWNPLADDGDALRLAVRLQIGVLPHMEATSARNSSYKWCNEDSRNDPYAATRRAIVRAAAAIGGAL